MQTLGHTENVDVGSIIDGRFQLSRLVGQQHLTTLYAGRDLQTGLDVAVKLVHDQGSHPRPGAGKRALRRELHALRSVDHPGIIPYLHYGTTALGQPYLITAWLRGKTLAERLQRAPLTHAETICVGLQLSQTLAAAHQGGIAHRALKPENVFLLNGDIERVCLIDFRLVHLLGPSQGPASASGEDGTHADIAALAALLFACLAKDPSAASELLQEGAPELDALLSLLRAMLDRRIVSINEVAMALSRMHERRAPTSQAEDAQNAERAERDAAAVSTGERRFVSELLIADSDITPGNAVVRLADIEGIAVTTHALAPGVTIAIFSGDREPTELATQAARAALAIRTSAPSARLAIASGHSVVSSRGLKSHVVARGTALHMPQPGGECGPEIVIDEVTAGLLSGRFAVAAAGAHSYRLLGENVRPLPFRSLLGRSIECLGRDRELAALESMVRACFQSRSPSVALVTGAPGIGKSRLGHELVRRMAGWANPPEVWNAHGDSSFRAAAPLSLLCAAIGDAMGIVATQPLEERRQRIYERVSRSVAGDEVQRVAEFLGEIIGTPFPRQGRVQLAAADDDARLMHDQRLYAWQDWVAAETAKRPVLLVLDDAQWSDVATIRFVASVLRNLTDRPLFVLALARPEAADALRRLSPHDAGTGDRAFCELCLDPLPLKASRELARRALGETVSDNALERLVERSQGNAYYLEELIRQVAASDADELPDTVIAMVQARLAALPTDARRVLRAASIFGGRFWSGGVAALVGDSAQSVSAILADLVCREFLVEHRWSRFAHHTEYGFRHGLSREAAYRSLPEDDRVHGHRRAAEWLVDAGESEALVLAEHYQRGGERASSVEWYLCAAQDCLAANDIAGVLECAERAIACGAEGATVGALRLLEAEAYNWDGDPESAIEHGRKAIRHLPTGSSAWAHAIHQSSWAASALGAVSEVEEMAEEIVAHAGPTPGPLYVAAMARCAVNLAVGGRYERARAVEEAIEALLPAVTRTPVVDATIAHMRGWLAAVDQRLDTSYEYMLEAVDFWREAGNDRCACMDGANVGDILSALGLYEPAVAILRRVLRASERLGLEQVVSMNLGTLAMALARSGELDEAERSIRAALSGRQVPRTEGVNYIYLAEILLMRGRPGDAEAASHKAIERLVEFPSFRAMAYGVLSQALLSRRQTAAALSAARSAMAIVEELGKLEEGNALVRLAYAEALFAEGELAGARTAIAQAKAHLLVDARRLRDRRVEQSFLHNVAENRRIIEFARRLGVP